jgi:hypothetical protein
MKRLLSELFFNARSLPESGAKATALQTLTRWPGGFAHRKSSWTAPAERSGDGAFAWHERLRIDSRLTQKRVALRVPPLHDARDSTESQRDSALKPNVARDELCWVTGREWPQPQRGCGRSRSPITGLRRVHRRRFSRARGCA